MTLRYFTFVTILIDPVEQLTFSCGVKELNLEEIISTCNYKVLSVSLLKLSQL